MFVFYRSEKKKKKKKKKPLFTYRLKGVSNKKNIEQNLETNTALKNYLHQIKKKLAWCI